MFSVRLSPVLLGPFRVGPEEQPWAAASLAALLVIPLPSGKTSSPNLAETVNLTERKKREEKDVSQTEPHKC